LVREILGRIGLLLGAHGERQRGRHVLQQQQLIALHQTRVSGREGECADGYAVDVERQRHHRADAGRVQQLAPDHRRFVAGEVAAHADLSGTHGACREAGIALVADADEQRVRRHIGHAPSGTKPRPRVARTGLDGPDDGAGVAADVDGDPAGFLQQELAIPNAQHRRVDGTLHLQYPGQPRDIGLLALAFAARAQGRDAEHQVRCEFMQHGHFRHRK
jgi:hypothetical protein